MEGCRNNPPKVLSVGCCDQPTLFHKVTIPAAVGDETTDPPLPGKFRNVLLVYEATSNAYLYSSDGIPTQISDTGEINRLEKLIKAEEEARKEADDALDDAILDETDARITADEDIWTEIRTIEAASDVVDVVGTYAELEAYDTSKLHDNDLIKVLQDETHGDAITYYRWSTATEQFSYVGEQGPYYTQAQTNALLDDKQDVLTAGDNIQISGNVISATDTTYTAGTGISIDSSNVISSTASGAATLYVGSSSNEHRFYHDSAKTELVTYQEMAQLLEAQSVRLVLSDGSAADVAAYSIGSSELRIFSYDSGMYRSYRWFSSNQYASLTAHYLQDQLIAGSNISISGNTISATDTTYTAGTGLSLTGTEFAVDTTVIAEKSDIPTVNDATLTITQNGTSAGTFTANSSTNTTIALTDTTYSAFTGTDGQTAGTAGLVPAPATTDAGKFLKADGTWDTAGGGTLYSTTGRNTDGAMTQKAITDALFAQGYDPATSASDVRIAIGGTTYLPTRVQQMDGIAIGRGAKSNGWKAIAIGLASENLDNSVGQIAIGGLAKTKGSTSIAIGEGAEAKGGPYTGSAVAIGDATKVDLSSVNFPVGAVAIGSKSTTSEDLTVSVGQAPDSQSEGIYRRIVNVADATTAHDAVTKGQLDTVAGTIPATNNISSGDWSALWQ